MKDLYKKNKLFFIILFIAAIGFLLWYFSNIVSYILIAIVVSLIGAPVVRLFNKIRIWKLRMPRLVSIILTMLILMAFFIGFFSFFIPLVVTEANMISQINLNQLTGHYHQDIAWLESWLIQLGVINERVTLLGVVQEIAMQFVSLNLFSLVLADFLIFTGNFFFGLFSVLFISFFFLMDPDMVKRIILAIIPDKYSNQTIRVMEKSKKLLSRYFIGLFLDVFAMIISYSIGLSILGVEGALVIAFFAGIINIIPYLGPLIGTGMGVVLGVTSMATIGEFGMIGHTALQIILVFLTVIIIDNVIYQPLIYGKSVKAHPIEIFLVIIAAGSIGGIVGMIIAVPVYTLLRIVAQEFLSQFKVVRSLTDKL